MAAPFCLTIYMGELTGEIAAMIEENKPAARIERAKSLAKQAQNLMITSREKMPQTQNTTPTPANPGK